MCTPLKIKNERGEMNMEIMIKIAERAERMGLLASDRFTFMMDLSHANEEFNLRLTDLANADDFNFAHDIVGIQNNINRTEGKMMNMFVPRYAGF